VSYSHDVGNVISGGTFYYAPPGAAFPFPAQYVLSTGGLLLCPLESLCVRQVFTLKFFAGGHVTDDVLDDVSRYQGQYFFADFGGSWVASVAPGALPTTYTGAPTFATDTDSPVDLDVTADGDLLVLSYSQGQVVRYRFVPSAAS
jgi:hypothetical protein